MNIPSTIGLIQREDKWGVEDKAALGRMSDGLISLVMSLRIVPQVRFLNDSPACERIAKNLSLKI